MGQLKDCINNLNLDLVVNALPSVHGLDPSVVSLEAGINLALANKESMLIAGDYLKKLASENELEIIPIDSEISTIFQCLKGEQKEDVCKIWLTASGGPLYSRPTLNLDQINVETIVNHPSWDMGPKISVDSATMVNKAFEVFEIHHFFGCKIENIEVVIHPQSQVHSLVEFIDGNIKALVGEPDMKVHISNAMSHPQRIEGKYNDTHFKLGTWKFEAFKQSSYPHFKLAINCLKKGGNAPAAFVMCNDFFVQAFLHHKMDFQNIYQQTKLCMESLLFIKNPSLLELKETIQIMNQVCEKAMINVFSTPT